MNGKGAAKRKRIEENGGDGGDDHDADANREQDGAEEDEDEDESSSDDSISSSDEEVDDEDEEDDVVLLDRPSTAPVAATSQSKPRPTVNESELLDSYRKMLICCVCLGEVSQPEDEIVECDACGISVHELCYGITADDAESIHSNASSASTEVCSRLSIHLSIPISILPF